MSEPILRMKLEHVAKILAESSRLSNHRSFVVVGSLTSLGALVSPPIEMCMSNDLDMYPKLDPDRGFIEIAEHLGIDSQFCKDNGFYADPISPAVLARPAGWEERLVQIPLEGGVIAWFMEVNDAAVGKLMRGEANDLRWLAAGLSERILDVSTILERCRQSPEVDMDTYHKLSERLLGLLPPESGSSPDMKPS